MNSSPHIVYIPGEVSVDLVEAVRMAIDRLHPYRQPFRAGKNYLHVAKDRFYGLAPAARRALSPIKNLSAVTNGLIKDSVDEAADIKARRVRRELLDAGITLYGLMKAESRALASVLHPHEHVEAIVYGQHHSNSVMLIATDERIIYLDKKPMAVFLDEVSYEVISGIEFEIHLMFATLTLHTPVKNYDIRYANLRCAEKFARHIEAHRLKREQPEKEPEIEAKFIPSRRLPKSEYPYEPKEDMAGYYWLPSDEEERRRRELGT